MQLDKDKASKNLKAIMEKMQGETDIALLGEYHKLFKKKVSLFRRSWAAAWLLMYYDQKEIPCRFTSDAKKRSFEKQAEAEIALSEDESKRLFISIGKNRRLFPREVIAFICSNTSAEREDIGIIRILDNYSFIQVKNTKAGEIIAALNGMKFRGRTLTVNYAKPKIDE